MTLATAKYKNPVTFINLRIIFIKLWSIPEYFDKIQLSIEIADGNL